MPLDLKNDDKDLLDEVADLYLQEVKEGVTVEGSPYLTSFTGFSDLKKGVPNIEIIMKDSARQDLAKSVEAFRAQWRQNSGALPILSFTAETSLLSRAVPSFNVKRSIMVSAVFSCYVSAGNTKIRYRLWLDSSPLLSYFFLINPSSQHTQLVGNWFIDLPANSTSVVSLQVSRDSGPGNVQTDSNDFASLSLFS